MRLVASDCVEHENNGIVVLICARDPLDLSSCSRTPASCLCINRTLASSTALSKSGVI